MSFEDWNKYFKEVFNGAWNCYSVSSDTSYRQWIEKGARWAVDFQNQCVRENKELKAENKKFKEALERLSKTGDGTHQDKKASFYDCLLTLQLEFDERIEYAREALKQLEGEE